MENPLSVGLLTIGDHLKKLKFNGSIFLPSFLTGVVLILVGTIFIMLWPYGLVAVMESLIRGLMSDIREEMGGKSLINKMPLVVIIGFYFVVWVPFAILCLPFILLGAIGWLFSKSTTGGKSDDTDFPFPSQFS